MKFILTILSLGCFITLLSTVSLKAHETNSHARVIYNEAKALEEMLQGGQRPGLNEFSDKVELILKHSIPVIRAYAAKRTQCKEQIEKVISWLPELQHWSSKRIRNDLERGAALPRARGCYDPRDIVAHIAIARAKLSEFNQWGSYEMRSIAFEIHECVEHLEKVEEFLRSN